MAKGAKARSWRARLSQAYVLFFRFWKAVEADMLLLRAAGMAYVTLASLVPLLLLVVGVLDGSGLLDQYYDVLEEVAFRSLLGELPEVRDVLVPGLRQADLSSLGLVGILGLVVVVGRLVMLVEDAYGATFGAPGARAFLPRLILLTAATFGGPVFLAIVAALLYDGMSGVGVANVHLPVALLQWVVLFVALIILPATRVRWMPALVGSFVSMVLLGLCALGFQGYVAWFSEGNPVRVFFGSMGVLPIFLLWIYLVWVSVLVGVEVAALVQYRRSISYVMADVESEEAPPLDLALAVLGVLASERASGRPTVSDEELAARLRLPPRVLGPLVKGWEERRLLGRDAEGQVIIGVGDDVELANLARLWRHGSSESSSTLAAVRKELDSRLRGTLGEAVQRWRRDGTFSSEVDGPDD